MKAAVFYAPGDVRVENIDIPKIGPGELLVQIKAATTCGTDVKAYRRGHRLFRPPTPLGHEWAGVVVQVGEGVTRFRVGDRVAGANSAPCGHCFYCKVGQPQLCDDLLIMFGSFAEYLRVPARIVEVNTFKLPAHLSFAAAAMIEPLACAVNGVMESGMRLGDTVVVNGAGPIGLYFVLLATLRGARVIVTDLSDMRLEVAAGLGAAEVINVSHLPDAVRAVRDLTEDGRGVDVAIEAVGLPETWEKTILMARKGGTVNLFGGPKEGTTFTTPTGLVHYNQLTLKGVFHLTPDTARMAFDLLANGQVPEGPFISGVRPLSQVVEALEAHARQEVVKYAIVPD